MTAKPILEYAGGVWGYIKSKDIDVIQSRAMRYYLRVHRLTPIAGMYGDMGSMNSYMGGGGGGGGVYLHGTFLESPD